MASIDYKAEGVVFDIQRFSLHDGEGIRTVVFLKGCPLSCLWCSNPESQIKRPVIMFERDSCIECGKCVKACKFGAISLDNIGLTNEQKCVGCGECANVCPTGARILKGEYMSVEEVVKVLKKDAITYRRSGGGVTLSGGEPLVQWRFSTELLKACKAQGWNTCIETTGYGTEEAIESVFPFVDTTLIDIKSMNPEIHEKYTGVSNELILKNMHKIAELSYTIIRVPTIPMINATEDNFLQLTEFSKTLPNVDTIHILPYHTYGENKYALLNREYLLHDEIKPMLREDVKKLQELVVRQGFHCVIGG